MEALSLTRGQRLLLVVLYVLIILMVFFSLLTIRDKGKEGFDRCVQEKCDKSLRYCSKEREIANCCQGAGGDIGRVNGQVTCLFP